MLIAILNFSIIPTISLAETETQNTNIKNKQLSTLILTAKLSERDAIYLQKNIIWKIFTSQPAAAPKLLTSITGGREIFKLPAGKYTIVAIYGGAYQTLEVELKAKEVQAKELVLDAGAAEFSAIFPGQPNYSKADLEFAIFSTEDDGLKEPYLQKIKPNDTVILKAGSYNLVAYYGNEMATQNNIQVEADKLITYQIELNNAQITLSLLDPKTNQPLENTKWSIVDESSDIAYEANGKEIKPILAAGEYTILASYNGNIYEKIIKVTTAKDQTITLTADPALKQNK